MNGAQRMNRKIFYTPENARKIRKPVFIAHSDEAPGEIHETDAIAIAYYEGRIKSYGL